MAVTVFDIDGVLADVRHRLHHLQTRPKDWKGFFAAAPADPVLEPGRQAILEAYESGSTIVYVTGRPGWCRKDTVAWLQRFGMPEGDLHYKADVISKLAREQDVIAVIDDDEKVVDHLRDLGLPVLHATWMQDEPGQRQLDLLEQAQEEEGRT